MNISKRGNITIFVILGMVILILIGVSSWYLFNYRSSNLQTSSTNSITSLSLDQYIEECLKKTTDSCIKENGLSGGYYNPVTGLLFQGKKVPYYFLKENINFIEEEEFKQQIGLCVEKEILTCTNEFNDFKDAGYDISFEKPKANVIANEKTTVFLDFNIKYSNNDNTIILDKFQYTSNFKFNEFFRILNELKEYFENSKDSKPLDISSIAMQNAFNFKIIENDDKSAIYSIDLYHLYNDNNQIESEPNDYNSINENYYWEYDEANIYTFNFAWTYKWVSLEQSIINEFGSLTQTNSKPNINPIGPQTVKVNEELKLNIDVNNPDNDVIYYYIDPVIENMNIGITNGELIFKPNLNQKGTHEITIVSTDMYGLSDEIKVKFIVE